MKILKILLAIIIAIAAILFIGSFFLPKTYSLTRSTVINAPDSVVYNNVADMNNFAKWNPWLKMEPTAKVTVTGTPGQFGHLYAWKGDETGEGQMAISKAVPYTLVEEKLSFIKPFESVADITFKLEPAEGGTKVDWIMSGENKSVMEKWMGLMTDMMMGKDFEDGLANLKQLSEQK